MHEILKYLPIDVRQALMNAQIDWTSLTEIRLRLSKKLIIYYGNNEKYLNLKINKNHMDELLEFATKHSAYAYENQLKQGFITVAGGHRIGLCGKAIIKDNKVCGFKDISSANVRIAHEIKNCGNSVFAYINDGDRLYNTLIIAPPGCGKTTLLRDIIRKLSYKYNIGVCDERGEIAASYEGIAYNDLGDRTDVIEDCDKLTASQILLRTMNPSVIAMDELGSDDWGIIDNLLNHGCKTISTIHGSAISEARGIINNFERLIVLSKAEGIGTIEKIYGRRDIGIESDDANSTDWNNCFDVLFDRANLLP